MMKQCKQAGLPEPEFVNNRGYEFRTILGRDVLTEAILARLGLNKRQLKAIKYVKEKEKITNKEYKELTVVSKPIATRDLIELTQKKVLILKGQGKRGLFYVLCESKTSQE